MNPEPIITIDGKTFREHMRLAFMYGPKRVPPDGECEIVAINAGGRTFVARRVGAYHNVTYIAANCKLCTE